jgi:Protein of unknown function (DUF2919)
MRFRYSQSSYDEHLCLKPPLLLWVALLYLSRAVSLPVVLGLSSVAGVSSDTKEIFQGLFGAYTLLPSFFAAVVLFALIRRSPSASRTVRWICTRGRLILVISALLDLALVVDSAFRHTELDGQAGLGLLTGVFDLYFLVYVLAARRVRDVFSDFPAPTELASR